MVVYNSREQRPWGPAEPAPSPPLAAAAGPLLHRGGYALLDLPGTDAEKLRVESDAPGALAALVALKLAPGNRQIHADLAPWTDLLVRTVQTPRRKQESRWMLQYIERVSETPAELVRDLMASLSPELEEMFVTTIEMVRAEGQAALLTGVLTAKFGEVPADVAADVSSATSDQLMAWAIAAANARTLDDVFPGRRQ